MSKSMNSHNRPDKSGQEQIRMLSIDDRMLTTDLDRAGYRNLGITVKHATSFAEAQAILKQEQIDIIVINLDYEKIDALGLVKHFKMHDPQNRVPVVVTSVQTTNAARNSADAAGADLFIEQPLPRQYFIEKLKKVLDKSTRNNARVEVEELVSIKLENRTFKLPIADISSSGMLALDEDAHIPEGAIVTLSFPLGGQKKPIEVKATAVRRVISRNHDNTPGVGLRFDEFVSDSGKRLEKYIEKTNDTTGAMRFYL